MDIYAPDSHRRHRIAQIAYFPYRRRIGLMGGSFNPAHAGHLDIATEARKAAGLDEVWWLVSPQNPLKSSAEMADFQIRLKGARHLARRYKWLRCLDIEQSRKLSTSFASLSFLKQICQRADLVWIMGADNLIQFPQWYRAKDIAGSMPILIMNRPGYGWLALASQGAALLGRKYRYKSPRLINQKKRGWVFCQQTRNPLSATALRQAGSR